MYPSAVTMLGCLTWIFMSLGSAPVSSKGILVKQYPSDLCVGLGHSAAIICAFEFDIKDGAKIDVYWLKREDQNEIKTVVHTALKNFPTLNTNAIHNDSKTGFRVSGNLKQGFLILELKNIQEADFGLYICKITGTIPPPHVEGKANGTLIKHSCDRGCTHTSVSVPGNTTLYQNHGSNGSILIAIVGFLATYALIITIIALVCQFHKKRSKDVKGDSMIYEDMNRVKHEMMGMRTY
uniref:T-cell-specific surface glycoprotein CD28 homolog n=1 Tax=Callorhinchus milii TaxID=7868 RepID=A0A4W3KJ76_CALMI